MYYLYRLGIGVYYLAIRLAALWQPKAQLWLAGRRHWQQQLADIPGDAVVCWFHTASLGEFEQGRPLIEAYREKYPSHYLLLSFFSPSGYEARKNYAGVDKVVYLPLDSPANASAFIRLTHPKRVIFIKYEYWYHYFMEIGRLKIPFYLISAVFRTNQPFFKPLIGPFWQKLLQQPTHIFVQDEASASLLHGIGMPQISVNSDTRFDRVLAVSRTEYSDPQLAAFCQGKTLIAGSSWPQDENVLIQAWASPALADWKLILVPHDLHEAKLRQLQQRLGTSCCRYTDKLPPETLHTARFLIIDTIGMLSKLYRYGQIAYIGGGFGQGIHNTLEAAVYGLPVLFGPKHAKFLEAGDLLALGAAFEVKGVADLQHTLQQLTTNTGLRDKIAAQLEDYFDKKSGATTRVMAHIEAEE
jgi:3-deoxy-D-manno-octulosonic-acid transferase